MTKTSIEFGPYTAQKLGLKNWYYLVPNPLKTNLPDFDYSLRLKSTKLVLEFVYDDNTASNVLFKKQQLTNNMIIIKVFCSGPWLQFTK
jgi:hypothetical protein